MPIKYVVNGKGYIVPEDNVPSFLDAVKKQGSIAQKVGDDYKSPMTPLSGSRVFSGSNGKNYVVPEAGVQDFIKTANAYNIKVEDVFEPIRQAREQLIGATLQAAKASYQDKNVESGDRTYAMLEKSIHGWNTADIMDMYETYKGVIDNTTPWGTTLARMRTLSPGKDELGGKGFSLQRIGHRMFMAFEEMAAAPALLDAVARNITDRPQTEYTKFILNYMNERERLTTGDRGFLESAMASLAESLPAMVLSFTTMGIGTPLAGAKFLSKEWGKAVLKNTAKVGIVHGLTTAPKAFTTEALQYDLQNEKMTFGQSANLLMKVGTEVLTESVGDAVFGVTVGKIAQKTVGKKVAQTLLDRPVKKMFTEALQRAGANFVTEGFIEEGSNAILNATTDMVTGKPDAWKNFYENYTQSVLLGGVSTIPLSLLGIGGAGINAKGINRIYGAVNEYANVADEAISDLDPAKQTKVKLSKKFRQGVEQAKFAQDRFAAQEITQAELDTELKSASDTIGSVITELNLRGTLSKTDERFSFDGELQHMLMLASLTHDTLANTSPAVEKHIQEQNANQGGQLTSPEQVMQTPDTSESVSGELDAEMQRIQGAPTEQTDQAEPTPEVQPEPAVDSAEEAEEAPEPHADQQEEPRIKLFPKTGGFNWRKGTLAATKANDVRKQLEIVKKAKADGYTHIESDTLNYPPRAIDDSIASLEGMLKEYTPKDASEKTVKHPITGERQNGEQMRAEFSALPNLKDTNSYKKNVPITKLKVGDIVYVDQDVHSGAFGEALGRGRAYRVQSINKSTITFATTQQWDKSQPINVITVRIPISGQQTPDHKPMTAVFNVYSKTLAKSKPKVVSNDKKDEQRVSGKEQGRQEPVQAEPKPTPVKAEKPKEGGSADAIIKKYAKPMARASENANALVAQIGGKAPSPKEINEAIDSAVKDAEKSLREFMADIDAMNYDELISWLVPGDALLRRVFEEYTGVKIDVGAEGFANAFNSLKTKLSLDTRYRQASNTITGATIDIGQMVDAITSLLPKSVAPVTVITGNTASITISYRGKPRQIVINSLTGRITDADGKPIYSGRTSINRDDLSSVMAIIDIVKNDNNGNMTAYHEGFHLAFALFLSEAEQRTLIEAYSQGKKLSDMTTEEIIAAEEMAARQFEMLIRGDILPAGTNRTLLQKLWDAIKTFARKLFGNDFAINHLDVLTRIKNANYASGLKNENPIVGKRYLISDASLESERQMAEVRAKYDGTPEWLKAPNGKPTKLNERQWLQVRTPAFKAWFGDWENDPKNASKVIDENGEPMVVFNGRITPTTIYDAETTGYTSGFAGNWAVDRTGIFFSDNKDFAAQYGENINEVFLNVRKLEEYSKQKQIDFAETFSPFGEEREMYLDTFYLTKPWMLFDDEIGKRFVPYLARQGIDGYVFQEDLVIDDGNNPESETYVVFSPTQIKSATANVGTFDPENADIRYRTKEDEPIDEEAMLNANETIKKIMDSGVEMSFKLREFTTKVAYVLAKEKNASQKAQLNTMIKKFNEYLNLVLPEMGFTKSTVLRITARFANIRTVRSFAKEASALDKMITQAYGKKLYTAILASAKSVSNDKVALRSTREAKTDIIVQRKIRYITDLLKMNNAEQTAEFQRMEAIDPGTDMSNEEAEMLEFQKWAVMLFSGLRVETQAKDGSTRYSYVEPAKIAQAYHELQSLIKNGKTLQDAKNERLKAEFEKARYKIKAMLLGGSSKLTDFDRQDLEARRKKGLTRVGQTFHAQLAFLETIFEEMDVLGYKNHKSLLEYKTKLEKAITDLADVLDEESTAKEKLELIDLKNNLIAINELISETAKFKGIYQGYLHETYYNDLYNAKSRYEAGLINYTQGFHAMRKKIAQEVGIKGAWHSYGVAAMNTLKKDISMLDSDGTRRTKKLSMQQIMGIYAQSLNPQQAETLINTGVDDTAMEQIMQILYADKIGKFAKAWVEYVVYEFMPAYYQTINEKYVERYGFDLAQELIYFPIERVYNKDVKMPEPGDPRPIMSESMYVGNTSLIARVNSALPLNLERTVFDAQLVTHIHNMEHFKAFAMPMYRARMTLLKKDVKQAFIDALGKQRWDTLTGFYRDQAANGYTQINKTTMDNVANWMMNQSAFIFLNLKPSVGLKQMSSTILMAGFMNPIDAAVNYAWAFKNIDEVYKIIQESPTFQIRYKQGITAEQHMALQHGSSATTKSLLRQYVNDYINFGKYGDYVSVLIGGGAYYHQSYKEISKANPEMPEAEVKKRAIKQMEKMVERTQQSASILYASRIRRDSMWGRLATQFQTQFHALYNSLYNQLNSLSIPGRDKTAIAWFLAVQTVLYAAFAAFFDDGLIPPDDPKDVAMGVISQNLAMIPLAGTMADTLIKAVVTGNYRQDYSRMIPSASIIDTAFKALQNMDQMKRDKSFRKMFEMTARLLILFGIPAYPAWQTIYGVLDYVSGKDPRLGRAFGYGEGQLDMVEREKKSNNK